jgi:hypothetical protein
MRLTTMMRIAAFEHVRRLAEIHDHLIASELRPGFPYLGQRVPLGNPQRGIFKPQQMRFLLSIKTVFPKPGGGVRYDDPRERRAHPAFRKALRAIHAQHMSARQGVRKAVIRRKNFNQFEEMWRPVGESNPCFQRERLTS